ncbi:MAG: hypothetical protein OEZ19_09625 [Paracoccaceae bacterium]|nr:hypothetical protein [Paracoccaceae bacterium]
MNLIRREVRQGIWRFHEALLGAVVGLLGLYWAVFTLGLMAFVGIIVALFGAVLLITGIQRGLFRVGRDGVGVVQVNEGQVIYFGPVDGGSIAVADLVRVDLTKSDVDQRNWALSDRYGAVLLIPVDAEGAEALFDVFSNLGGVRTTNLLSALHEDLPDQFLIWQTQDKQLH